MLIIIVMSNIDPLHSIQNRSCNSKTLSPPFPR